MVISFFFARARLEEESGEKEEGNKTRIEPRCALLRLEAGDALGAAELRRAQDADLAALSPPGAGRKKKGLQTLGTSRQGFNMFFSYMKHALESESNSA